jgi:toxin secretion/phage lysis holin
LENLIVIKNTVVMFLGVIGSVIASAFGGFGVALQVLIIFIIVDYITGLVVAGVFQRSGKSDNGALESRAGWKGLCRKVFTLVLVLVAAQVDRLIGQGTLVRDAVILTFVVNEGLSILENIGLMGVPMPDKLKNALEILKGKAEKKIE